MKRILFSLVLLATSHPAWAAEPATPFVEHISALTSSPYGVPVKLKKGEIITTKALFKPPVEILVEAKTASTNLRLAYAADQVIFNWEMNRNELVINGGPAGKVHKLGAGIITPNQYVTIRWLVTPGKQSIFVNNDLRFEHSGDYSTIDKPVSIFSIDSDVTVKSIKVRSLAP